MALFRNGNEDHDPTEGPNIGTSEDKLNILNINVAAIDKDIIKLTIAERKLVNEKQSVENKVKYVSVSWLNKIENQIDKVRSDINNLVNQRARIIKEYEDTLVYD